MKSKIKQIWNMLWNASEPVRVLSVLGIFIVFAVLFDLAIDPHIFSHIQKEKISMLLKSRDPESQIVTDTSVQKEILEQAGLLDSQNDKNNDLKTSTTTSENKEIATSSKKIAVDSSVLKNRPQFVVLAFDGSRSLAMWDKTLTFAEEMKAKGYPIHYTYFLNAVYFLDPPNYKIYQAPHEKAGVSNIGFATSKSDVLARIAQINRAIKDGHDIGSHNAGHFNGTHWTYDEWVGQFKLFNSIMFNLKERDPEYQLNLQANQVTGFRAPELGVNPDMYKALKDMGFTYDTSKVGKPTDWPTKDKYGLWQFSLPTIYVKDIHTQKNKLTIGMDYNFYVQQSGAKDRLKRGTSLWNTAYENTLLGYKEYFYKNYNGNHAPVYVANHFSYWNDGLYWQVMQDFASEVCVLKDVRCVSFKELEQYMESLTSTTTGKSKI